MISVREVSAGYHNSTILRGVTMDVPARSVVGIIGPNGCGKTTLLRVISGVLPCKAGQVLLKGKDVRETPRRILARSLACLSQDISTNLSFNVREIVSMGRAPHISRLGLESRGDIEIVENAMKRLDVLHLADRPITETSGGERQRAYIAMCLAQQPEVLLLDEPTNHLDLGHRLAILDLIKSLNTENSMTVLGVFHDLNLASEYCDALVIMNEGKVEAIGPPEEVLTEEMISRIYKANARVERNPVSNRPCVIVSAGMNPSK